MQQRAACRTNQGDNSSTQQVVGDIIARRIEAQEAKLQATVKRCNNIFVRMSEELLGIPQRSRYTEYGEFI
jgi:hypothetical protein